MMTVTDPVDAFLRSEPDDREACSHGPRVRQAGHSRKNGKPWAALMCPARQCDPVWVEIRAVLKEWATSGPEPTVDDDEDEPPF